jgi:NAD(P)-dependent dehydrogenase (short-subunit alcohol dehydrogenase family)
MQIYAQALHVAARPRDRRGLGHETATRLAAIGNRVITAAEVEARAAPGSPAAHAARLARRWGASVAPGADVSGFRLLDSTPAMHAVVSEQRARFHPSEGQLAFARSLLAGPRLAFDDASPRSRMQQLDAIELKGHESRLLHLQLHIPSGAHPGEQVVFTFEQWTGRFHMGGYAAVVEVEERQRE